MNDFVLLRLAIRKILEVPEAYPWSIQGLGMLRLYLNERVRLHVWAPVEPFKVAAVSELHNHPWDFRSLIIAGQITNHVYTPDADGKHYKSGVIECGPNPGCCGPQTETDAFLKQVSRVYNPGAHYAMQAETIHRSESLPGTVTLCSRMPRADRSPDHATVCWAPGTQWVSAEPRLARHQEAKAILRLALDRMDEEDKMDYYIELDDGGSVGAAHPRHYRKGPQP